jgi:DNA primase
MGGAIPRDWCLGFAPGGGKLARHLQQKGFTREELIEANVALSQDDDYRAQRDRFFNRIMFPIRDLQGRAIAFGGRIIGQGEPKYLNSSDTLLFHKRDNLYAIDRAKAQITVKGSAIVVEGYTDVIAMHEAGFVNTVATLGTALTPQHLKLLARFTPRVVLLFDGDEAGQRAADKAADLISVVAAPETGRKADLFVAVLPQAMDPADYCAKAGPEAMQAVLDRAVALMRFALDRRLARWDLAKPEQRARALDDVVQLLVPVKGTLLAADYLNYLADVFAVDSPVIATALERAKPVPAYRSPEDQAAGADVGAGGTLPRTGQPVLPIPREPAIDRAVAFERELLFLYVEEPEVRAHLRKEFDRITWSDERHKPIVAALLDFEVAEGPDALLSRLTARVPDAADVLSGARLSEFMGVSPNRMADMLIFNIEEGRLKRTIRSENARLRRLGEGEGTLAERDELFKQIAELQQKLNELRKAELRKPYRAE